MPREVARSEDVDISTQCCGIVKSCPGKGEIALRVLIVIALILMVLCAFAGANAFSRLEPLEELVTTLKNNSSAAFIWILVAGVIAIVFEAVILIFRFGCSISKCTVGMLAVDIVITFVIILSVISGIAPIAVYTPTALRLRIEYGDTSVKTQITAAMGATAGFGILAVLLFVTLNVYMILSLLLKCKNTSRRKYTILTSSGSEEEVEQSGKPLENKAGAI